MIFQSMILFKRLVSSGVISKVLPSSLELAMAVPYSMLPGWSFSVSLCATCALSSRHGDFGVVAEVFSSLFDIVPKCTMGAKGRDR